MKIYSDSRLLSLGVINGTVSRQAGNMRERENQDALFNALSIPTDKILRLHQIHSDKLVSVLDDASAQTQAAQTPLTQADGWILIPRGWGAAVLTADCVPLFLWDENAHLTAIVHAGWRGVAQLLHQKTAQELKALGARGKISAYLGPHIQKCCFEVQQDAACQFDPQCVIHQNGKMFVDLTREIIRQLALEGVAPQDVYAPDWCTCGNKEQFFSYRRDHQKDVMLSFIYKP